MSIVIRKPGILSTIQDNGRHGYSRFGVNPGGAMDPNALRTVNILLGNDENAAVIEMHFPAAEIEFAASHTFAVAGADFQAELNGRHVRNFQPHSASTGDILRFTSRKSGSRTYLSIVGGLKADEWLSSKSTNLAVGVGGYHGRRLAAGDEIAAHAQTKYEWKFARQIGWSLRPTFDHPYAIRVVLGPEHFVLDEESKERFVNDEFTISQNSDRMGYRLMGEPLHRTEAYEMVSSSAAFGTIQLLPDGRMIVLMADHQTSGGYPRIANVISVDLPVLAQMGTGDRFGFAIVSIDEAESLTARYERELAILKVGCALSRSIP